MEMDRQDIGGRLAETKNSSDIDDIVKGAAVGMRGLRHLATDESEQSLNIAHEHSSENIEREWMLANLQGLA